MLGLMMLSHVFAMGECVYALFTPWRFNSHLQWRQTWMARVAGTLLIKSIDMVFDGYKYDGP